MKYPYRVAAVLLACIVVIPFYIMWSSNKHESIKKLHLMQSQIWPLPVTHHPIIQYHEECKFAKEGHAKADIDTFDILTSINEERKVSAHEESSNLLKPPPSMPPKEHNETLTVIVVPHSHSDPGWLNTLGGYFNAQTKPTLMNALTKLKKYPKMTFIWAESVFLSMWWEFLSDEEKSLARKLVHNGQLEIAVGSWVVPDEANPHYFAIIDQMIEGHQFLQETLGVKPKSTWSLDPFGYSSTMPYLYKNAGYENMVILRVHHKLKDHLQKNRSLEFYWRQHWDQHGTTDIQTLMMPYKLYNIKHTCGPLTYVCLEFDFRNIEGEQSESRAVPITDLNLEEKARKLVAQYRLKSSLYKHNVVLVPLGDDFRYDRSIEWDQQYKNYMKLFNFINSKEDLHTRARFGTLQDYFDEVKKQMDNIFPSQKREERKMDFPSLSGDFFPYTDQRDDFWTGYFTTRPFWKKMGREVEHHLRAADILLSLAMAYAGKEGVEFEKLIKNLGKMKEARRSLGLFQHHDAITGTARDYVAQEYLLGLSKAVAHTRDIMESSLQEILVLEDTDQPIMADSRAMYYLNPQMENTAKIIDVSVSGTGVLLFNPTAQERKELVQLNVNTEWIEVRDSKGKVIPCQSNPVWESERHFRHTAEIIFYANLKPLGITKFTLFNKKGQTPQENYAAEISFLNAQQVGIPSSRRFKIGKQGKLSLTLENDHLKAVFSPRLGTLKSVVIKKSNTSVNVAAELLMYKSKGSGAYIFSPEGNASNRDFSHKPLIRVIKGPLSEEVHVLQIGIEHRVRISNTNDCDRFALDIENIVDIHGSRDKEIIMRLNTDIKSKGNYFYTDLNGFHIMRRKTFSHFPLQANYYPMTSMAYLDNGITRLSLLSNQPAGVASLQPGWLEVMLDRRLTYDDGRGLGQGVEDNKPVFSQFKLLFESRKSKVDDASLNKVIYPSLQSLSFSHRLYHPVLAFTLPNSNDDLLKESFTPLQAPFPCDILLLNLRAQNKVSQLNPPKSAMILHHLGFDCDFPVEGLECTTTDGKVFPGKIFKALELASVEERTLSLMHKKGELSLSNAIALKPMELGTYLFTFQVKSKKKEQDRRHIDNKVV